MNENQDLEENTEEVLIAISPPETETEAIPSPLEYPETMGRRIVPEYTPYWEDGPSVRGEDLPVNAAHALGFDEEDTFGFNSQNAPPSVPQQESIQSAQYSVSVGSGAERGTIYISPSDEISELGETIGGGTYDGVDAMAYRVGGPMPDDLEGYGIASAQVLSSSPHYSQASNSKGDGSSDKIMDIQKVPTEETSQGSPDEKVKKYQDSVSTIESDDEQAEIRRIIYLMSVFLGPILLALLLGLGIGLARLRQGDNGTESQSSSASVVDPTFGEPLFTLAPIPEPDATDGSSLVGIDDLIDTPTMSPVEAIGSSLTSAPTFELSPTGDSPISSPVTSPPTRSPTWSPTKSPTPAPTRFPTSAPTRFPTSAPTRFPTSAPTKSPTSSPTGKPTQAPTRAPTVKPTQAPTRAPTTSPTAAPLLFTLPPIPPPTSAPFLFTFPTIPPTTAVPTTAAPTSSPTVKPQLTFTPVLAPVAPAPVTPIAPPTNPPVQPTNEFTTRLPPFPEVRFTLWDDLFPAQRAAAGVLGYTEFSWNRPRTSNLEFAKYSAVADRGPRSAAALVTLRIVRPNSWDCWVNHYFSLTWAEIENLQLLDGNTLTSSPYGQEVTKALEALGWTQATWDAGIESQFPPSESKVWSQLTEREKEAAGVLCYNRLLWDEVPIPQWN